MRLDEVRKVKMDILAEMLGEKASVQYAVGLQGNGTALAQREVESRIAVGFSRVGTSTRSYQLELRVQREGRAYRAAKEIRRKLSDGANIEIIPHLEIPSREDSREQLRSHRRLCHTVRPLHIGLSIGHVDGYSGTLGGFVELSGGRAGFISCNHVMALFGRVANGEPNRIYQPGPSDKHPLRRDDAVATLADFIELSTTQPNESDSATAALLDGIDHVGNRVPEGFRFAGRRVVVPPEEYVPMKGADVFKIGKRTAMKRGKVSAVSVDGVVVRTHPRNYAFNNVIEIDWLRANSPFSRPGDSGSLVFTEDRGRLFALGLVFAGGVKENPSGRPGRRRGVSLCCTLENILQHHEVEWL